MKKVLLATDGSEFSAAAVRECCGLIRSGDIAALKIVSIYEAQVPIAAEPMAISSVFYQKLNDIAEGRTERAVQDVVEELRREKLDEQIDISTRVELGQPSTAIVDIAREWGADLIIVGSHGRGFWGRLALGSVSDWVVHHAPCSVLVVRTHR